jgi:hypothetical protein
MPTEGEEGHWMFHLAATWADQIRGNKDYDRQTWHYVDFPVFVDSERKPGDERPPLTATFNRTALPGANRIAPRKVVVSQGT